MLLLTQEMQRKRQEEVEALRDQLQQLSCKLESLDMDIKKMSAGKQQVRISICLPELIPRVTFRVRNKFLLLVSQIEEEMANIKGRNSEKEETYKVKKKTLDLLPDAENNIAKLQVCS